MVALAEVPAVPLNVELMARFEMAIPDPSVFGALIVTVGAASPMVVSATPHTLLDGRLLVSPV
jgi:hypothetical protein